MAERWLFDRYWHFSAAILVTSLPLLVARGSSDDVVGLGAYVVLSVGCFVAARYRERLAVRAHMTLLVPFWTWYVSLSDGFPHRYAGGAPEYVSLLLFPLIVLIALDGLVGAAPAIALAVAGIAYTFSAWIDRGVGLFLLSTALMIGSVFRRLVAHLEAANGEARAAAFSDPLTGLVNRQGLAARPDRFAKGSGAFLFVDVMRFRTINEVFGHTGGDELLKMLAQRLRNAVPERAELVRMGADEFAIVLSGFDEAEARVIGSRVVESIAAPFAIRGATAHVAASVGIALWPAHGVELEQLLECADAAVSRARQTEVPVQIYSEPLVDTLVHHRGFELEVTRALREQQLVVHFQAVVDLRSGAVAGAEALVRWQHPKRGLLSPAAFIDFAEQTGQVRHIDEYVLRAAAAYLKDWSHLGFSGWVAVNMSARSLEDPGFIAAVESLMKEEPDLSGRIVLELTESAAMRDPESSSKLLARLHEMGVSTAIDDFGMGYSSLAYLKNLTAHHVKLDRAFVSGIGVHRRDEDVVELVLQLASRFGLKVIAEGVENESQRRFLAERHCDFAQGFGLGRPMPAVDFIRSAHIDRPSVEMGEALDRASGVLSKEEAGASDSGDDAVVESGVDRRGGEPIDGGSIDDDDDDGAPTSQRVSDAVR